MGKIFVAVTIDVENPQTPLFEKRFADNRIWSDGYGIEKIIEILDKHGVKGTFFTNVYEYVIWGKGEMERIVRYIHDKGHDVELHTHPIWIDEKRRENMFQFPLQEQEAIINFGADLIEDWTGRRPVCHRAGAYGFDKNTLIACREAGISIDSSNFYGHPNCKFILTKNEITKWNGIIEAPVTFFQKKGRIIKTDLDWMDKRDLMAYLKHIRENSQLNFINLFLHSYSLTCTKDNFKSYALNTENMKKLEHILKYCKESAEFIIGSLGEIPRRYFELNEKNDNQTQPEKMFKNRVSVIRDFNEEVIFVKSNPQIRIYKQAKALKITGKYKLTLIAGEFDANLFKGIFDEIIMFEKGNELVEVIKKRRPYIFHAHAEPNVVPYLVIKNSESPVIFDAYDFSGISSGIENLDEQERKFERFCFENADGIVRKGPPVEIDYYKNHGYRIDAHIVQWMDYCDEDLFAFDTTEKLSEKDGELHLVYTGNISIDPKLAYCYYIPLGKILARQKIHLHLYPNPYQYLISKEYLELDKNERYFHFHKPVPYTKLSWEIAKYDWGIWIHPVYGNGNMLRAIPQKCKVAIGNKLFSYLEAALPVIVSDHLEFAKEIIYQHEMGLSVKDEDLLILRDLIMNVTYDRLVDAVHVARKKLSLRSRATELVNFYKMINSLNKKRR